MQIFSIDVVPITSARARLTELAADHLRNLHDLTRAASDAASDKAIPVAAFRKQAAALVARVARNVPAAQGRKTVKHVSVKRNTEK